MYASTQPRDELLSTLTTDSERRPAASTFIECPPSTPTHYPYIRPIISAYCYTGRSTHCLGDDLVGDHTWASAESHYMPILPCRLNDAPPGRSIQDRSRKDQRFRGMHLDMTAFPVPPPSR
ncbi:hypothetical protein P154DRAFT_218464 [Amniculicola lignicola CBS 123094]|uniref:Uncharacterized protein n=1 Tax=Amniculicola lignicola CBS 123094 TaxID=1392246 RepID=A0A6A5X065_9PLEO|nr:hypothetical protein P154DRAFT_218464 [Amniculicola lignicola CBS 123094]